LIGGVEALSVVLDLLAQVVLFLAELGDPLVDVPVVSFEEGESFGGVIGVGTGEVDELLDVRDRHARLAQAAQ